MADQVFRFKQFEVAQDKCAMKIGTDGVLLGAWVDVSDISTALDIGSGTGVIALIIAQRSTQAQIEAVEIDENSFEQTEENFRNAPWSDRLQAQHDSIQNFSRKTDKKYDLIISNPPFFTGGTLSSSNKRNSVRHTVKLPSGDLLRCVQQLLSQKGRFALILPYIEGLKFQELALSYNLHCTKITEVRPRASKPVERLLMQFEKRKIVPIVEELIVYEEEGNHYTKDYIELTKAFYLNM